MFRFDCPLYPIVDTLGDPQLDPVAIAAGLIGAGVPLLQLRWKQPGMRQFVEVARVLRALTVRAGVRFIVNDRVDVARLVAADGVHLGQDDLPVAAARELLGPSAIIGLSTHNLSQAVAAERSGAADYIGFGPMYATTSKEHPDPIQGVEGLQAARRQVGLPIAAIGGITTSRVPEVLRAGADAVAMIGEIVRAPDIGARVAAILSGAKAVRRG